MGGWVYTHALLLGVGEIPTLKTDWGVRQAGVMGFYLCFLTPPTLPHISTLQECVDGLLIRILHFLYKWRYASLLLYLPVRLRALALTM